MHMYTDGMGDNADIGLVIKKVQEKIRISNSMLSVILNT